MVNHGPGPTKEERLAACKREQALKDNRTRLAEMALDQLYTDEERCGVLLNYCHGCGRKDPTCRCWDDS